MAAASTFSARMATSVHARLRPVVVPRGRCAALRATPTDAAPSTSTSAPTEDANAAAGPTYFYRGRAMTESQWAAAKAAGELEGPAPITAADVEGGETQVLGFGDLMAFSGPVPELVNGRLAMLAMVAALGAELASGEGVLRQLAEEPTGIFLAAVTFIAASLIPYTYGSLERPSFGPFTPSAEMLNGRAAMIGFAALIVVEAVRGGAALF